MALRWRALRALVAFSLVGLPFALTSVLHAEATEPGERSFLQSFAIQSEGNDPNALNLGSRMETSQAITITRIRFYKLAASTGTHTAHVWSSDGTVIATQALPVLLDRRGLPPQWPRNQLRDRLRLHRRASGPPDLGFGGGRRCFGHRGLGRPGQRRRKRRDRLHGDLVTGRRQLLGHVCQSHRRLHRPDKQ